MESIVEELFGKIVDDSERKQKEKEIEEWVTMAKSFNWFCILFIRIPLLIVIDRMMDKISQYMHHFSVIPNDTILLLLAAKLIF